MLHPKHTAKVNQEAEQQQNIQHAAEFKHANMANKDFINTTPCPLFTPKVRPPPRDCKKTSLAPVIEISNNSGDNTDAALFKPPYSEGSVTEEESAAESDPQPPAKKLKVQMTGKVVRKAMRKVSCAAPIGSRGKAAHHAEEVVSASDEEVMPTSDEESSQKLKKQRSRYRMQL
jgi:hypothetical protein